MRTVTILLIGVGVELAFAGYVAVTVGRHGVWVPLMTAVLLLALTPMVARWDRRDRR